MRTGNGITALGLMVGLFTCVAPASAQFTANSLAELRNYGTTVNNSTVTLSTTGGDPHPVTGVVTPGEYWINGDHIANPTGTEPIFMDLSGTGNTYNLSGTTIKADTRKFDGYGRALGHGSGVHLVQLSGSNNLLQDLTLIGEDIALDTDPNAQRYADWGTQYVKLFGDNLTLDGATVVVRGSRTDTYGLSDAFGKGASQGQQPYIGHRKAAGVNVDGTDTDIASNNVVNNLNLTMKTFGHGFFTGSNLENTTLSNSTITGELFPSQMVIDRPEYQQYGRTWWGYPIQDDIMLSGSEGGVRTYGGDNFTVENVVVDGMRTGFATVATQGDVNISNSYAYNTTSGFDVGDNTTITGSGGNIVNGPLLVFYGSGNNTSIDLELTAGDPIGVNWSAAYFNGNADISIHSDLAAGDLPEESYIRLGQRYFENWRDSDFNTATPDSNNPRAFNNQTFVNDTNQILVIGENAVGNVGRSQGGVISNGKENYYDGVTLVPAGTQTVVTHEKGLGNSGAETGSAFDNGGNVIYTGSATAQTWDDNGTVVESGGTLELSDGIWVKNERITISGNGVGGIGALYTDGETSFGFSSRADQSTVYLAGNAAIGVGGGGELTLGGIQGQGNLTKVGPGKLSLEYASSYVGNMTIAEGELSARSNVVRSGLTVFAGASFSSVDNNAVSTTSTVFLYGELDVNARTDSSALTATVGQLFGSGTVKASNQAASEPSTLTIETPSGSGYFLGQVQNNLNLVKAGAGSQVLSGNNTYAGTTTVSEGLLQIDGTHTGGGDYVVEEGGTLGGGGNIAATVVVQSGGSISPGASAGELTIASIDLQTGSLLEIEIGGTTAGSDYDLLSVGDISLGGQLQVSMIGSGFTPSPSDVFTVVSATALSGAFENVASGARLSTIGGEGSFLVSYSDALDAVSLTNFLLASIGLAGDFNSDGMVDSADYTMWRDTLGQTGLDPYSGADATGDGVVDSQDYAMWRANFGQTVNAGNSQEAVPEPSALVLLLGMLAYLPRRRRL